MAGFIKYKGRRMARKVFGHHCRDNPHAEGNIHIDADRKHLNECLTPDRADTNSCLSYYDRRLSEVYHINRKDLVTLCEWTITIPKELRRENETAFFEATYDFLNHTYGGERNCLQCTIHRDEGVKDKDGNIIEGRSHMHYVFMPITQNEKYGYVGKSGRPSASAKYEERLNASTVLTKTHLKRFHQNYQKWLDKAGIDAAVYTGVTKQNGGNRRVAQLKIATLEKEREKDRERIAALERELEHTHDDLERMADRLHDSEKKTHVIENELHQERKKTDDIRKENNDLKRLIESLREELEREKERSLEREQPSRWDHKDKDNRWNRAGKDDDYSRWR